MAYQLPNYGFPESPYVGQTSYTKRGFDEIPEDWYSTGSQRVLGQGFGDYPHYVYDPYRGGLLGGEDMIQTAVSSAIEPYAQQLQGFLSDFGPMAQAGGQETTNIDIPTDVFPFAQSGMPFDQVGGFAEDVQGFLTDDKLMQQQQSIRNALMGTWDQAFGGRLSPQLGKLSSVGMLGGTAQERMTSSALAQTSTAYDKMALDTATKQAELASGLLGQSYYYADPLAPYTLWADIFKQFI